MRFLHLADLHFGKSIHNVSMVENGDQQYWMDRLLELIPTLNLDAIVVAGDVYDKTAPSGDTMKLMERFITSISNMNIPIMMIAGNHDSGKKLSYVEDILSNNGIYISGELNRELKHITVKDSNGEETTFWLMPYVFPALVSNVYEDADIKNYDSAVRKIISQQPIDFTKRNVMIAHQNVVAEGVEVEHGGSESVVGGVGAIEYTAFDGFDYVALGHIHSGYHVGREEVRYAGTPLCYHFDELKHADKGALLVEINAKGEKVNVTNIVIEPLHALKNIVDEYEKVEERLKSEEVKGKYVRVELKNRKITPEVSSYLRGLVESKNGILMELKSSMDYEAAINASAYAKDIESKSLTDLFTDFYKDKENGNEPTEQETECLRFVETLMSNSADTDNYNEIMNSDIEKVLDYIMNQI